MTHQNAAFSSEIQRERWSSPWLPLLPFVLFALFVALNPVGFIGGDADDFQYLEAARCWLENGVCLPRDHWQGRWPIIAPLAGVISLMGEARWTVAIPTLVASLACLMLVNFLGTRLFDKNSGRLASALLAVSPVFVLQALDPNVDSIELALILAGFAAMAAGRDDGRMSWPALCGLCFGLALQVRETAFATAPTALVAFALVYPIRSGWKPWIIAGAGFVFPFIVEALVYTIQTGDPLWRRRLSLGHTRLSTTELQGRSHVAGLPFFNRELIENWRHEPGLSIHWAIDGLLNLIVNPRTGGLLILLPFLYAMCRHFLAELQLRMVRYLMLAAVIQASVLIYVFAIDPKPRMMLPALVAGALALSPMLAALMRRRPAFASLLLASLTLISAANILAGYRSDKADVTYTQWIGQNGGQMETARQTQRRLVFVDGEEQLAPMTSDRPLLLLQVNNSCSGWLDEVGIDQRWLPVVRSASLGTYPDWLVERQAHLCIYRYGDPRADGALRRALGVKEFTF
ncbi:MAG: glycosyltransferase family 39 protein [Pseudomonadota bacterium]|nr:glycosyltransferase family 39 protein [Pseudomonadota bacterium]